MARQLMCASRSVEKPIDECGDFGLGRGSDACPFFVPSGKDLVKEGRSEENEITKIS